MFALLSLLSAASADPLQEELHRALSAHDGGPTCASLLERGAPEEVRDALLGLARDEVKPPAVPMRAASCSLALWPEDAAVLAAAHAWMADPGTPGLALLVVRELDRVPAEAAVSLADAAVARASSEPRFALHVRPALERSARPEVRARAERIR